MRCSKCMSEYDDKYDICPFCGTEKDSSQKELYFLNVGTVIQNRYEIGLCCGSGGFGITYRAWDRTLEKSVAIKEYYPVGLVNRVPGERNIIVYSGNRGKEFAKGKERFLEEARNMAQFNTNINIVNVFDFFEENNTAYIVMEYLDGITFKEYLKGIEGPAPIDFSVEVVSAVLNALGEVHKTGILHRDISPDNVFLCRDGKIKLIDFGAARFSSTEEELTRSIILKPGFAPPEQYQSKSKQGPWTDIYAVGAMLYRAITGIVPDESVNRAEEDTLANPNAINSSVNLNLNNSVLRAMALQPELRFKDTKEFLAALSGKDVVKDVRVELKRRKKRRIITITAATLLAIIGIGICMSVMNNRKAEAAVLEPTNITVWVSIPAGLSENEMQELYDDALTEFGEAYPQVGVNVEFFAEDGYRERVLEAQNSGSLPTLFSSTGISEEELNRAEDLSEVLNYLTVSDYLFIDEFDKYYVQKKKMPTAFSVPVVYIDNVVAGDKEKAQSFIDSGNYVLQSNESDYEAFLNMACPCLLGDITVYDKVQSELAGVYRVEVLPEVESLLLTNTLSISSSASARDKAAAIQVIVYLLTQTAQDIMYVQNGFYLPLNETTFNNYLGVNKEFGGLDKSIKKMSVIGQ